MKFKLKMNWISATAIGVIAYLWAYPILWSISLSFRDNESLQRSTTGLLQGTFTLDNYISALTSSQTPQWFINSLIVATMATLIHVTIASLAGYAFARLEFFGKKILYIIVLFGLMIPEQAVFIPMHSLFAEMGWHNTYFALIAPRLPTALGVLLMTQFFKGIPASLDEAAAIDRATKFQVFYKLILPLSKPALATLGIFTFLGAWNDYLWPLVSATDSHMYTITVGLSTMLGQFAATEQLGFLMASAMTASLPMIILFVIFQKYIVQGVTMNVGK